MSQPRVARRHFIRMQNGYSDKSLCLEESKNKKKRERNEPKTPGDRQKRERRQERDSRVTRSEEAEKQPSATEEEAARRKGAVGERVERPEPVGPHAYVGHERVYIYVSIYYADADR